MEYVNVASLNCCYYLSYQHINNLYSKYYNPLNGLYGLEITSFILIIY